MARVWVYQDDKQVKKHGADRSSWYVGWVDPGGKRRCKSCGPGAAGKKAAEKLRKRTEEQLNTGTYDDATNKTWAAFRKEYEEKRRGTVDASTWQLTAEAMAHFERLVKPVKMT